MNNFKFQFDIHCAFKIDLYNVIFLNFRAETPKQISIALRDLARLFC